jgi:hypothetical protein
MISRVLVVLLLVTGSLVTSAQDKVKKVARPDIPGSFLVDIGVNRGVSSVENFKQGFWGSRTLNLYYQYPLRFGRSKFSFNPGLGVSLERFKLKNNYSLNPIPNTEGSYSLYNTDTVFSGVKKSMIVANYFEIPLEFRFDSKPEDVATSFNFAVGARAGILFDGLTKIKYKEDGETKTLKNKQNHGLNPFRYGVYTRIGVGGFNLFFTYNLTPLFEKDKGPDKTTMSTFTTGISINGF